MRFDPGLFDIDLCVTMQRESMNYPCIHAAACLVCLLLCQQIH